ncbi:MAG: phytanoyl-CoA dioxygenase family protein [Planctomycetales bacterium]|nr:phytanoyl-CoA dioxygenase family protein [Planctomycetales bacterium]
MSDRALNEAQIRAFGKDGYVLVPAMFEADEMGLIIEAAAADHSLRQQALARDDGEGGVSRLAVWNHPGDDLFGMFARCDRVVTSMERLLGGEVYHYHSKMMLKEPKVGGAWAWHQDYGYWYHNGCLLPLLASCMIAVNNATRQNGCLQVLKGSQVMGRIEHMNVGTQVGADPERVEAARGVFELVHCEMAAGDALFFDCNLLHRSDANRSDDPRWTLICCYNAARNNPYKESRHPRYTPLKKVPDSAIKKAGLRVDARQREYMSATPLKIDRPA